MTEYIDAKDVEKTKKEELQPKQVEKILKGGNHTVIIQIEAEVCLNCGERLYKPAFLTNNAIAIYRILIEKRFRAFFIGLIFDTV